MGEPVQMHAPAPASFETVIHEQMELLFITGRGAGYGGGYKLLGSASQDDYVNMCMRVAKKIVDAHTEYTNDQKASVYFVAAVLGTGNAGKFAKSFLGKGEKGADLNGQLIAFMGSINVKSEFARKYTAGNCTTFIGKITGVAAEADAIPVVATPAHAGTADDSSQPASGEIKTGESTEQPQADITGRQSTWRGLLQ